MEARIALAFVARRAAARSMPASRWAHLMGFELRWMAPGEAKVYVDACTAAGLLTPEGDELSLTFDPKAVEVPRGFRPDPRVLPGPGDAPLPSAPQVPSTVPSPPVAPATAGQTPAPAATVQPPGDEDVFAAWLPRVAEARGEDVGAVMAAIEAGQTATPGLHAEVVLLRLGAEAGLDVRDAAAAALTQLRA